MNRNDTEKEPQEVLALECGASLAEHEHVDETETAPKASLDGEKDETIESLRDLLASDVVTDGGKFYTMFASPFEAPRGPSQTGSSQNRTGTSKFLSVPLIYCDQTASNRPVKSIERYMEKVCLPLYGNTHTNTSITGSQR
jgi:hypothetical protein